MVIAPQFMVFVDAWRDQNLAEIESPAENHAGDSDMLILFGGAAVRQRTKQGKDSVFYGVPNVHPLASGDKRLFRGVSDTFEAEKLFEQIIRSLDLTDEGNPIFMRFDALIDLLCFHYTSNPEKLGIPALQYALYSLRQLPLDKIKIPSYPSRPEDEEELIDDDLNAITDGIFSLCEAVANIYENGSSEVKQALDAELTWCIKDWSWADIFQVILSIAQHAGNYEWAAMLHQRLVTRNKRIKAHRLEAMARPDKQTPNRLAQTYLNYLEIGGEPNAMFCYAVERLFQERFEYADWVNCDLVRQLLLRLPDDTRERLCQNDKRLRVLLETFDPATAQRPEELKQPLYRPPKDPAMKSNMWKRVNEFLNDPKSKWAMMSVLTERGKNYDSGTITHILQTKEPENAAQRRNWIRTLTYCRNRDSEAILMKLWTRCALYQKYKMLLDKGSMEDNVLVQIDAAENWLQNSRFVEDVLNDDSIDILVGTCLINDHKDHLRRLAMLSALIAAVPSEWINGETEQRRIWKRLVESVHLLWNNARRGSGGGASKKSEVEILQPALTISLKQLAYTSVRSADSRRRLDRALYNFCKLFQDGTNLRMMYHAGLVKQLLNAFTACDYCPLSSQTQNEFIKFLNKRHEDRDVKQRNDRYAAFLIRWCEITKGSDNENLVRSRVFHEIVGTVPTIRNGTR